MRRDLMRPFWLCNINMTMELMHIDDMISVNSTCERFVGVMVAYEFPKLEIRVRFPGVAFFATSPTIYTLKYRVNVQIFVPL